MTNEQLHQQREGLITCREAAERVGIVAQGHKHPERAIHRLYKLGHLRGRRVGKAIMIDPRSVVEYVECG